MKYLFTFLSGLFLFSSSFAQSDVQIQSLANLGKVWGFLKYYHPQIADGRLDWDSVLIQDLSRLESAASPETVQVIIQQWLDMAGQVPACEFCVETENDTLLRNLDLRFLEEKEILGEAISEQLIYIRDNRFLGERYYARQEYAWGGPANFENEKTYNETAYPDRTHRMLSLFRYWNAIHYYYPYKYLIGEDWNESLKEFIPQFYAATDSLAYHLAARRLTARIYDSHSYFNSKVWTYSQGAYRLPIRLTYVDQKTIITEIFPDSLAELYPLEKGDQILSLNGKPVQKKRTELEGYLFGSNESATQRKINNWLLVFPDSLVELEIERDGHIQRVQLEAPHLKNYWELAQRHQAEKPKRRWQILEGNIGYVNLGSLEKKEVKGMMKELMDCSAIVFDVRNYPKGTMYEIARFLNPKASEFARFSYPDPNHPGALRWVEHAYKAGKKKNRNYYRGKVIVLQNEITQSHAEFTIMALQSAPDCTVIGSQTAAADGNVTRLSLAGGISVVFTGLGVYYPDGRETQRIGIQPDIEILPSLEGIRAGRDEVLEYALSYIKGI